LIDNKNLFFHYHLRAYFSFKSSFLATNSIHFIDHIPSVNLPYCPYCNSQTSRVWAWKSQLRTLLPYGSKVNAQSHCKSSFDCYRGQPTTTGAQFLLIYQPPAFELLTL